MKSRSLLSFLALAVAAVSPALAAEVPSTLTDTLAQLDRIETQVRAARQEGQTERLAELREELRQLPVPASEAVRASRIWASMQDESTPVTKPIAEEPEPVHDIKMLRTVWSLDSGTFELAPASDDDNIKLPGTVWSLADLELAANAEPGDPPVGKGSYWSPDLSIPTVMSSPDPIPDTIVKPGYWDPESFELAPRSEHP